LNQPENPAGSFIFYIGYLMSLDYEVLIVGGGPAGLSAALILGRCRRRVLLNDDQQYRNASSKSAHGFLSRDGADPALLRQQALDDLHAYKTVSVLNTKAVLAKHVSGRFQIVVEDGQTFGARKLLLATGITDKLPQFLGFNAFYGTSIHPCPYCDAWEHRDTRVVIYGNGEKAVNLSVMMKQWSDRVTVCTDGEPEFTTAASEILANHSITVRSDRIASVEGDADGALSRIIFTGGKTLACSAIFTALGVEWRLRLFTQLGCLISSAGGPNCDHDTGETSVKGVYAAGDASRDTWLVIVAAAEGAKAAVAINKAL
jgi:thioredoxin reductase